MNENDGIPEVIAFARPTHEYNGCELPQAYMLTYCPAGWALSDGSKLDQETIERMEDAGISIDSIDLADVMITSREHAEKLIETLQTMIENNWI